MFRRGVTLGPVASANCKTRSLERREHHVSIGWTSIDTIPKVFSISSCIGVQKEQMNRQRGRTFQPSIESLERRYLFAQLLLSSTPTLESNGVATVDVRLSETQIEPTSVVVSTADSFAIENRDCSAIDDLLGLDSSQEITVLGSESNQFQLAEPPTLITVAIHRCVTRWSSSIRSPVNSELWGIHCPIH